MTNLRQTTNDKRRKQCKRIGAFFLLVVSCVSLLMSVTPALAQTTCNEVPLPPLLFPGAPQDPCASPAAYITYWFYFSLYLGGVAALLIFVAGGVLYLVSGVYPAGMQKATHMMQNALLGIILLFGIWLLLNIINPSLVTLKNPTLPPLKLCFVYFTPDPVVVNRPTTFSWSILTKGGVKGDITCTDPALSNPSAPLQGDTLYTPAKEGFVDCTVRAVNEEGTFIDACDTRLIVKKDICTLRYEDLWIQFDRIYWQVPKDTTTAILSCGTTTIRCPAPQPIGTSCTLIPPLGTDTYIEINPRAKDTCTFTVKTPGDAGECSVSF